MPLTMEAWVEGVSWVLLASNVRTNVSCWLSNSSRDERTHGCSAKLPSLFVCLSVWSCPRPEAPSCPFLSVCLVLSRASWRQGALSCLSVWSCPGPRSAKVHVLVCLSGPFHGLQAPRCTLLSGCLVLRNFSGDPEIPPTRMPHRPLSLPA
jgi:hypothetical protein